MHFKNLIFPQFGSELYSIEPGKIFTILEAFSKPRPLRPHDRESEANGVLLCGAIEPSVLSRSSVCNCSELVPAPRPVTLAVCHQLGQRGRCHTHCACYCSNTARPEGALSHPLCLLLPQHSQTRGGAVTLTVLVTVVTQPDQRGRCPTHCACYCSYTARSEGALSHSLCLLL